MSSDSPRYVALLALALTSAIGPAALAQSDFGDAPDGVTASYPGFPGVLGEYPTLPTTASTRFPGNIGIEHDVTTQIRLGGAAGATTVELTPNVTDLDEDNSGAFVWISLTGIPSGAAISVPVTIDADAPAGPYYLNVLIDQNNDGEWKDTPSLREWAVRDRPIDQAAGTTRRHSVPVWWSSSLMLLPKWVRITVSDVPVGSLMTWGTDGWDGSTPAGSPPSLSVGETEDRFVGGVYPGTAGPGGGPPPGPGGGGVLGGAGGGAIGKGIPGGGGGGAPGACEISIECRPRSLTLPCGDSGTIECTINYLSGNCPPIVSVGNTQCNAMVSPRFIRRLRGTGPRADVSPNWDCTTVGPGARTAILAFTVIFPPPCDHQVGRKERWTFDLDHDPDGVYGVVGPDEQEGIILSSVATTCGNGIPEPPFESCDDGNLVAGDTCAPDCQFPTYFANGVLEPGEECDDGNVLPGDGCSSFGIREYCGNTMLDPHEACDDGNTIDGDGCNRFCQPEGTPSCPNGAVDHLLEQCDDGNSIDGDGCDAYCQDELCGDRAIDLGEQCDDGNSTNGDGCSALCQSEGACGNGWKDPGEGCDDGNTFDEDGCSSTCQIMEVHVTSLRVLGDKATVAWDPVIAPLRSYDLLRGSLGELRSSGGDLDTADSVCLETAHPAESAGAAVDPAAGEAFYYLVRVDPEWPAIVTWEPRPPSGVVPGLRDGSSTVCD